MRVGCTYELSYCCCDKQGNEKGYLVVWLVAVVVVWHICKSRCLSTQIYMALYIFWYFYDKIVFKIKPAVICPAPKKNLRLFPWMSNKPMNYITQRLARIKCYIALSIEFTYFTYECVWWWNKILNY